MKSQESRAAATAAAAAASDSVIRGSNVRERDGQNSVRESVCVTVGPGVIIVKLKLKQR